MTRAQAKKHIKTMLKNAHKAAMDSVERCLNSGCIDPDNIKNMIVPRAIAAAILEREADQLAPLSSSYMKEFKSCKKNCRYFV